MSATRRLGTASMVLATAWTMAGRVAEAQLASLPLSVAIYDYAALAPPVVERVKQVVKSNSWDAGDLLGVIMAHEIGHLLLPPDSHATGIMAPKLDPFLKHGGLAFGPRQASMIRARIGSMPRSEQGPCGA